MKSTHNYVRHNHNFAWRENYRGKQIIIIPSFDDRFGLQFGATVENEDWEVFISEDAQIAWELITNDINCYEELQNSHKGS